MLRMTLSLLVVLTLGVLLPLQQTMAAPAVSAVTAPATPETFIQQLGERAVSLLSDKAIPPEQRNEAFQQLLRDSFDLPTIGRFVVGRNVWAGASQEEKDDYLSLFEKLVVRIYSDRFSLYSGETFRVVNLRHEGDRDTIVTSHILPPNSTQPILVDWRVRNFDGRLGIIDVIVEGISMSVTQRQEYSSVLQRYDNRLAPLNKLMRESLDKQDARQK